MRTIHRLCAVTALAKAALVGSRDTVSEPEGTERNSNARITLNAGPPLTTERVEVTSAVIG